MNVEPFLKLESEVRSYCRSFPVVFTRASGEYQYDEAGRRYIDFFAGAGSLNYGHNPPALKQGLIEYLAGDGVTHSLDMYTTAKRAFLESVDRRLLKPRGLDYKVLFPGPTGTNAVEAALKTARNATGRSHVIAFTNAFHGMTLGSLSLTGNATKRAAAGVPLGNTSHMPFCGYLGSDADTIASLQHLMLDSSSGVEPPAAFIVETVQAEGGVNVATVDWLKKLADVARQCGALLIIDDIQVGCGRTGPFFSFEVAGLKPDIVCLSKSLSGYGLPLSVVLLKPELDGWKPGEHNGTFRGHNPAFITATNALETYWADDTLTNKVYRDAGVVRDVLRDLAERYDGEVSGRGMIMGLSFEDTSIAPAVSRACFEQGLIIETAGASDNVVKLLPPLTIGAEALDQGLEILKAALKKVVGAPRKAKRAVTSSSK